MGKRAAATAHKLQVAPTRPAGFAERLPAEPQFPGWTSRLRSGKALNRQASLRASRNGSVMAHPILTCEEIRDAERLAAEAGISLQQLMLNAGTACADYIDEEYPDGRIVVLCGPGNNGGDGFVAASRLARRNRRVVVFEQAGDRVTAEREWASKEWPGARHPLGLLTFEDGDVIVDALFGAGLARRLEGSALTAVKAVAASGLPVVSIDLPTGVNGDTAELERPFVRATATVTFGALKPAHILLPSAECCGDVIVAPIGFEDQIAQVSQAPARLNGPELWEQVLRWPKTADHKHLRGRLTVVSGDAANTGAARLAAQAGLRIGAGLTRMMCPPDALPVAAASLTAVMCGSFENADALASACEKADAVVIGPAAGVTAQTRANVEALARAGRRLVLDADALSVFKDDPDTLKQLLAAESVLTPHAGEFERLFPHLLMDAPNRIEAVRTAAARTGAVVLLKGPDTTIAAPDGRAAVNTHASPFLATAGSGDVLAGVIGGLMAQGLSAFDAASAGAWMHGDAGIRAGPGLTAEDLDGWLRIVFADLYATRARR